MAIFNSLGSNYDLVDVWLALKELVWPNQRAKKQLVQLLSQHYQGKAVLLYSGRDAIEYCLEAFGIGQGTLVLTQAFSCCSIEEAIKRVKATPHYFDLAKDKPSTSLVQIKQAYQQAVKRKQAPQAVIIQHTLGYLDEVEAIAQFCRQKHLLLIEDLAQAAGAKFSQDGEMGSLADAVILSFGRDKVLDAVSGGAVIFKNNSSFSYQLPKLADWFELKHDLTNKRQVLKLLLFPTVSWLIRHTYSIGLGKLLHRLAQKSNLITTPILSHQPHYQSFPAYFAPLVLRRWHHLQAQLKHRRQVASYYLAELKSLSHLAPIVTEAEIKQGTNLRFPIAVKKPEQVTSLLKHLKKNQVYLEDRWYKQPVDSGSLSFKSEYQPHSCPHAEWLTQRVINLPTHRAVNHKQANKITQTIKRWDALTHNYTP